MSGLVGHKRQVRTEDDGRTPCGGHCPCHRALECESSTLPLSLTYSAGALFISLATLIPQQTRFSKQHYVAILSFSDCLLLGTFLKDLRAFTQSYPVVQPELVFHFRLENSFVPDIFDMGYF